MNDRIANLAALANMDSESDGYHSRMSLAATIMQILYYVNKTIPTAEWNGKNLSGINIPGANLSEQNFRKTKFLNANLNNVILDGCDCSYCDMSGARLGETNKITALKFDGQGLLSLYKDGSLRQWDINYLEETSCTVIRSDLFDPVFGNGTDLFAQNNQVLELLGKQKNEINTYMRYLKNQNYSILSVYEERILIRESKIAGDCIWLVNTHDFSIEHQWHIKKNGKGILVKNQFAFIYDGDASIELYSVVRKQPEGSLSVRVEKLTHWPCMKTKEICWLRWDKIPEKSLYTNAVIIRVSLWQGGGGLVVDYPIWHFAGMQYWRLRIPMGKSDCFISAIIRELLAWIGQRC